jgi:hypothetical protein
MTAVQPAGLTQWSRFDVPGMWSLLRDVSTVEAFKQAGAWQSTYEAAQSLAARLQWYRDGLAGKWSPDRSDAAALYLGRLDELIGSAQQLADVSVSNRQALVTLANAVDDARPKLQRVYEESQAMRQVGAQPRAGASVALAQQQLQKRATEIMESLGGAAMDSWRHYATADNYEAPQPVHGGNVPVAIPAAVGVPDGGPSELRSAAISEQSLSYTAQMKDLSGPRTQISPDSVLPVSLSGTSGPTMGDQAGESRAKLPVSIDAPFREMGIDPTSAFVINQHGLRSVGVSNSKLKDAVGKPSEVHRPDSIVGERSIESLSSMIAGRGQSVNAVGGVIGGQGAGVGMSGLGAAGLGQRQQQRRRREYDLDNPWYVAEGVLPVLRPSIEPTHFEPGPGVIGIDR